MFKFPSTPHLISNSNIDIRNDKLLTQKQVDELLSKEVFIEEKIDGANLGISFSSKGDLIIQNRGNLLTEPFTGQWIYLRHWLDKGINYLFDSLTDRYILFGEWCFACHSIYYNKLPDWFLGFDVYDKENKLFLPLKKRNELFKESKIKPVPFLAKGVLSVDGLLSLITTSAYSLEQSEGIYIKQETEREVTKRAKIVRPDFIQNMNEHWSRKALVKNKLIHF
ncbi:RNA ligase, Pab1020 family [Serratia fonticola]|uniref:RNA ligase family protein n=1 Tax=Serratia fonticola TaxID=47917 RepID=UPI0021839556|nr:RNA ligase family protein [Serratia fonticola]CAI2512617.1 RNA ligase, Pab1020 family [Serratia fonticola]